MKNGPLEDVLFPIENGDIPACYVSLPRGYEKRSPDVASRLVNTLIAGFEFHPRSRSFQKITTPLSCDLTTDLSSTMAALFGAHDSSGLMFATCAA